MARRALIVLFARRPVAGRVKTRLGLAPERAAELHRAFVRETLTMLATIEGVDVELSTDEPCEAETWPEWTGARSVQCAGDLGTRMFHAIEQGLRAGREKLMIVGSDSPGLPCGHLSKLLDSTSEVALGPTDDGGYYAIACRRSHAEMFHGVRWSCASTLADTVRSAEACGLSVEIGPQWFDVDTPADLERLRSMDVFAAMLA